MKQLLFITSFLLGVCTCVHAQFAGGAGTKSDNNVGSISEDVIAGEVQYFTAGNRFVPEGHGTTGASSFLGKNLRNLNLDNLKIQKAITMRWDSLTSTDNYYKYVFTYDNSNKIVKADITTGGELSKWKVVEDYTNGVLSQYLYYYIMFDPVTQTWIEMLKSWDTNDSWYWNKEEAKGYFIKAGGSEEEFNDAWKSMRLIGKAKLKAIEQGTYVCSGGHIIYLISAKK